MRIISAFLLVFAFCAVLFAQDAGVADNNNSAVTKTVSLCNDSNEFATVEGVIRSIEYTDEAWILNVVNEGGKFNVRLAGIKDFTTDDYDEDILTFFLLDRQAKIVGNKVDGDRGLTGIVTVDGENLKMPVNINEYILEKGWGKYAIPQPTEFSNSAVCRFPELEAQAKAKKLGIWAK